MTESGESQPKPNKKKDTITTIDDCILNAGKLYKGLIKLSQQRHPLEIRRGVRGLQTESENEILKTIGRTYFFDLEKTRNGKPYLKITESRLDKKNNESIRNTILVFEENIEEFSKVTSRMATKVNRS